MGGKRPLDPDRVEPPPHLGSRDIGMGGVGEMSASDWLVVLVAIGGVVAGVKIYLLGNKK